MKYILTIIVITLFSANSCEDSPQVYHDNQLEGEWILTGIQDLSSNNFEIYPENIREMNLQFIDSKEISGAGSCNTFHGYFVIPNQNSINIDNLTWTEIGCMPFEIMNLEEKYFQGLLNASEYSISGNGLTISTSTKYKLYFIKD